MIRAKVQLAQFGAAAMIDDRTRTDAARAAEVLAGTGKTLLDAARFLLEHIRRSEGGKPLGDAVADFLKAKRQRIFPTDTLPAYGTGLPLFGGSAKGRYNGEHKHRGH